MMYPFQLALWYCVLSFIAGDSALESPPSSPTQMITSLTAHPTPTQETKAAADIMFQSTDGGKTWQDISEGLPEPIPPEGFFAGESAVYLRVNQEMYRSQSTLNAPVWEKEHELGLEGTSIAFNLSGVTAYNFEGQFYRKMPATGAWQPIYTSFEKQSVRTVFEASDGAVFVGYEYGLYKSTDRGLSWKRVLDQGWVMDLVESEGVLLGTGQNGIMRSTDHGESWEWVISEGGVGIAVERIEGGFVAIASDRDLQARRIYLSLDRGATWEAIDEGLRPSLSISSIKQVGKYLVCGHPDGIFRSSDLGKTWRRVHHSHDETFPVYNANWKRSAFGDNQKVFTLYVSGEVLYAVKRDAGC